MLGFSLIPWRQRLAESVEDSGGRSTLSRLHSELDRMFEEFFGGPFAAGFRGLPELRTWAAGWAPTLDVSETEDEVTVQAEVAGVDPKDIDISLEGDFLILSGEKKEEREERKRNYYRAERSFGAFRRQIRLPASVDKDRVNAEYNKGVLTIRLPKSVKSKAKRIPVHVHKN